MNNIDEMPHEEYMLMLKNLLRRSTNKVLFLTINLITNELRTRLDNKDHVGINNNTDK